jgi:putative endonuclease
MPDKRFVYLLRSKSTNRPYFGLTSDITTRLAAHNAGQNKSTAAFRPWVLVTLIEFSDEKPAADFERFLKTGSGRVFAKKHLM